MSFFTKQKQPHALRRETGSPKTKGIGGRGAEMSCFRLTYHTTTCETSHKDPQRNASNLHQHAPITYVGKEPKKECEHIYTETTQAAVDWKGKGENITTLSSTCVGSDVQLCPTLWPHGLLSPRIHSSPNCRIETKTKEPRYLLLWTVDIKSNLNFSAWK